jgi:enoyl-CoA hydratase/carnithine racemase
MGLKLKTGSGLSLGGGLGLGLGHGHAYAATGTILGLSLGTVALAVGGTILAAVGIRKLLTSKKKNASKTKKAKGD